MKILQSALFLFVGLMSIANAADITIFYSPSCPHCHHARDFFKNELIYEYDDLKITEINATIADNRQDFIDALNKCKYKSGGVPVMVVGDECFQGYGDSLRDVIRASVESDLTDAQKKSAELNRQEMAKDKDAFVSAHSDRLNAIVSGDKGVKKN